MFNKSILPALILLGLSNQAYAEEIRVGVVSEYLNQGQTQSYDNPAIQAEVSIKENKYYASVWGSTTSYDGVDLELNFIIGKTFKLNHFLNYDVGVIYYSYYGSAEASSQNYTELMNKISFNNIQIANYTSFDYSGSGSTNTIFEVSYEYNIKYGTVYALIDWNYSFNKDVYDYDGKNNYFHFQTGLNFELDKNFDIQFSIDVTNLNSSDYDNKMNVGIFSKF